MNTGAKEVLIKYVGDTALIIDSIEGGQVNGRRHYFDDNHQEAFTYPFTNDYKRDKPNGFFIGGTFHKISDFEIE